MSDSTEPASPTMASSPTRAGRASASAHRRLRESFPLRCVGWMAAGLAAALVASAAAATDSGPSSPAPPATLRLPSSGLAGGWLLSRAPIPGSQRSGAAVMHAVDPLRSDIGLAGLMLRCGEHGFDAILVVVTPYPPSAAPQVTIASGAERHTFAASVLPTGAALALPAAAADLAQTVWRRSAELSVSIADDGATVNGIIPIPGLDAALQTLLASCPAP